TVRTETIETPTMVRPADPARIAARMVELKAIQPQFPLYGSMTLEGGQPYSHTLLEHHGALVRPELLSALGVKVGDSLAIGTTTFVIRGVVANEPGRNLGAFSLGPRVFVDFDDMPSTTLLVFGSRARRVVLARPRRQLIGCRHREARARRHSARTRSLVDVSPRRSPLFNQLAYRASGHHDRRARIAAVLAGAAARSPARETVAAPPRRDLAAG